MKTEFTSITVSKFLPQLSTQLTTQQMTNKTTTLFPVLAIALLFSACSQQRPTVDAAIPAADGGVKTADTSSKNPSGTNTQGVNTGGGSGTRSTGSGGGYQTGGKGQGGSGQGNNQYYDYGDGTGGTGSANNASGKEYTLANLNNPNSLLSKRIIYFDYNQATIKPEYQAILDAHAAMLAKNPNVDVRLEGHADERGTREYNVALSEERAKAVQWIMRGKGVNSSQSEVIAYGEERPAVVDSGEQSWAKNRRVEIKYPGR